MAMSPTHGLAAAGPAPVYAAVGRDMRDCVDDLFLLGGLRRVDTPRAAGVLLVAGGLRPEDAQALRRLHDQMPHPRGTCWWEATPFGDFGHQTSCADAQPQMVVQAVAELNARLLRDPAASEPDLLPDEPPAPWQGMGAHGQGGEGMMGGKPYGRTMAMTEEDLRDGLQLDAFRLRIGPFAPMLPPGMVLELTLQGDVIQRAAVRQGPFPQRPPSTPRAFLRKAARMLELLELPALAERCRRRAQHPGEPDASLLRAVRWSGALAAVPPGSGRIEALGTDARARLQLWLDGRDAVGEATPVHLDQLLPGLEWQEAMLVIASLDGARFAVTPDEHGSEREHATHGPAHDMHSHGHHAHGGHG